MCGVECAGENKVLEKVCEETIENQARDWYIAIHAACDTST